MSKVASFDVDHLTLREGVYVRSEYRTKEGSLLQSWDIRLIAPGFGRCMSAGAMHVIEHTLAHYLRVDTPIADKVISVCPMGCLTGLYIVTEQVSMDDMIKSLQYAMLRFPIERKEDVVALNESQCGNPSLCDLSGANIIIKRFLDFYINKQIGR